MADTTYRIPSCVLSRILTRFTVNNIGPQTRFPVPEGIMNHNGKNYVALTLWALDESGAKLSSFKLVPQAIVQSGYMKPALVEGEKYAARVGAY